MLIAYRFKVVPTTSWAIPKIPWGTGPKKRHALKQLRIKTTFFQISYAYFQPYLITQFKVPMSGQ